MPTRKQRLVLGVTGIRSDYDIMSSVFRAVDRHPGLTLKLIVTGAHLAEDYGRTVDEIRRDGFTIADEVESLINGDGDSARVKGLAIQLQGMVQTAARLRPDFLLVLGDREETISTALVGSYMNIPVGHVGGGDSAVANVDDHIRHAVTKLAHLHFVTNEDSRRRVLSLGEQPFRVHNVGNPGLDRMVEIPKLTAAQLSRRLGFEIREDEPLILLIQHVLSSEIGQAYAQMDTTLDAVQTLGIKTILSYPNSDAGGQQMIRAIEKRRPGMPHLYTARNIPRLEFINIMRRASCMIGNSSAGILETPLLKLPVVNIGNRQRGRLHAENVQFVGHDAAAICAAVRRALGDKAYRRRLKRCSNPYGDGHSSRKIADILARTVVDDRLLIKEIIR